MNGRVGYRFHPTDEELVSYFLQHKIRGNDCLVDDDIHFVDICKFDPWDLPGFASQGSDDQEWYFFYQRELKNKNTSKICYKRSTRSGHWKSTGKTRFVKTKHTKKVIGMKRNLVFYLHGSQVKTNWVIHEYELKPPPPHQADLVLCKLKEKADKKADSSGCEDRESAGIGASDFESSRVQILVPEVDRGVHLEPIHAGRGVTFRDPSEQQPLPFLADQGISIDDLMLPDDVFDIGSNGMANKLDTSEPEEDPFEMADGFLDLQGDGKFIGMLTLDHNVHSGEGSSNTHRSSSSWQQPLRGGYKLDTSEPEEDPFEMADGFLDLQGDGKFIGMLTLDHNVHSGEDSSNTHSSSSSSQQSLSGAYKLDTSEPEEDPFEMAYGFLDLQGDGKFIYMLTLDHNVYSGEDSSNTHSSSSSSQHSLSGVYLNDIDDMDAEIAIGKSLQPGASSSNSKHCNSKEYLQMQRVQTLTETLPPSIYEQNTTVKNHVYRDDILGMEASSADFTAYAADGIKWVGVASKERPIHLKQTLSRTDDIVRRVQIQGNFSSSPDEKDNETTKHLNEANLPLKGSIIVKSEKDKKVDTGKASLKLTPNETEGNKKIGSFILMEASPLNPGIGPPSVYIVNVFIGLVLFIAAIREVLILH